MIVVRNVFQLQFGKARDAKVLINELQSLMKKFGQKPARYMTDLAGTFYTLVMESSYENLSEYEKESNETMGQKEFEEWYRKFVPLVNSGYREIFAVMD